MSVERLPQVHTPRSMGSGDTSSPFAQTALTMIESMKKQSSGSLDQNGSGTASQFSPSPANSPPPQRSQYTSAARSGISSRPPTQLVVIRPPPENKLAPCFPNGYVQEREAITEAETLRRQYNRRPPWDKTPAWRPMSRSSAADVFAPNGSGSPSSDLGGSLSPLHRRALDLARSHSPKSVTSAGEMSPGPQHDASLSPARSDEGEEIQQEKSWEAYEKLEMTNASLLRPAGKSLLAQLQFGELNVIPSPKKTDEKRKQFYERVKRSDRSPDGRALFTTMTYFSPERPSTTIVKSKKEAASATSFLPQPPLRALEIYSKDGELQRLEWELERQQQRRMGAFAAKLVGAAVPPQAPDSFGVPLNYVPTHRQHHEAQ
jgi:hypothetical protein